MTILRTVWRYAVASRGRVPVPHPITAGLTPIVPYGDSQPRSDSTKTTLLPLPAATAEALYRVPARVVSPC